jgi:hypothetical protein
VQLVRLAAGLHRIERRVGGQHAGLDRRVAALDPRRVQEARVVADQRAAREHRLRQRQQPPAVIARAPYDTRLPPSRNARIDGCVL